jgi:hypothetical protein
MPQILSFRLMLKTSNQSPSFNSISLDVRAGKSVAGVLSPTLEN